MQLFGGSEKAKRSVSEAGIPMDAVEFLKEQHREVDELFKQIEESGERAFKRKEGLFAELAEKLTVHAKLEEGIFYPAAKEADEALVLEAFEEHANVKAMIRKLQKTDGADETFDAKIKVLKELVKHHVKEEENELFPKCKEALGEEKLEALGVKMKSKFATLSAAN